MVCQVHAVVELSAPPPGLFDSLKGIIRNVIKGNDPLVELENISKKN